MKIYMCACVYIHAYIYIYIYIYNSFKLRISKSLDTRKFITEKELKHFPYDFINTVNLVKLFLLPKCHKRLYNVPAISIIRPVISNRESNRLS